MRRVRDLRGRRLSRAAWVVLIVAALGHAFVQARASDDFGSWLAVVRATIHGEGSIVARANQTESGIVTALLLARSGAFSSVRARITSGGGDIRFADDTLGYLRARVSLALWASLRTDPAIEALQLDGHSEFRRGFQEWRVSYTLRPSRLIQPPGTSSVRPASFTTVMPDDALRVQREGDALLGLPEWRQRFPERDGRGVRIAAIDEIGLYLTHPMYAGARDRRGASVPKVATIVDAVSRDDLVSSSELAPSPISVKPVHCEESVCQHEGQVLQLPRPGHFERVTFNLGGTLVEAIADRLTGEVWVDTNGDHDFAHEQRVYEYERSPSSGLLAPDNPFYVSRNNPDHELRLYVQANSHIDMAFSLAAGAALTDTSDPLGLAPGAQVVPVRTGMLLSGYAEGLIRAVREAHADVIVDTWLANALPNHGAQFIAVLERRLFDQTGALLISAAGNGGGPLETAELPPGAGLSAGAVNTPLALRAFGHVVSDVPKVAPWSGRGPAFDGSARPDVVVPTERFYGTRCDKVPDEVSLIPIPPCFALSSGTSASTPTVAGLVALLLSGAEGQSLAWRQHVSDAVRYSATPVPAAPLRAQGWGIPHVGRAFDLAKTLVNDPVDVQILRAPLTHALTASNVPPRGVYIRQGWLGAQEGDLAIDLQIHGDNRRGPFVLALKGDDSVFDIHTRRLSDTAGPQSIHVHAKTPGPGIYSAFLTIARASSGTVVSAVPMTIVASTPFSSAGDYRIQESRDVAPYEEGTHVWSVPEDVAAMLMSLDVRSGTGRLLANWPSSLRAAASPSTVAFFNTEAPPGRYRLLWPQIMPGVWGFSVTNEEVPSTPDPIAPLSYSLSAQLYGVHLAGQVEGHEGHVTLRNMYSPIGDATLRVTPATRVAMSDVITDTRVAPAILDWHAERPCGSAIFRSTSDAPIVTYIFDCTSGYCYLHDQLLPAPGSHLRVVRSPAAGLWKLAVMPWNTATAHVQLGIVDTTRSCGAPVFETSVALAAGASRHIDFRHEPAQDLLAEIVSPSLDALERDEPFSRERYQEVRNRPVCLGWTFLPHEPAPTSEPLVEMRRPH